MTHERIIPGVDIVGIDEIRQLIDEYGDDFLEMVYTPAEILRYRGSPASLAARAAAKEAVGKVFGGLYNGNWREIEILSDKVGRPTVTLYGSMLRCANELGLSRFALSLAHEHENNYPKAVAFVIAT